MKTIFTILLACILLIGSSPASAQTNLNSNPASTFVLYLDFDGHSDQTDVIFVACKTPDVEVFPNPFENNVVVKLDKGSTRKPIIKIRDLNGKEVFMLSMDKMNQNGIIHHILPC
jgi:predicted amino acid dehydrogenase